MRALTVVLADVPMSKRTKKKNKDFWDSLSRNEQEEYLKEHPNSKYKQMPKKPRAGAKDSGAKDSTSLAPAKRAVTKLTDLIKGMHKDQQKFFQDGQHKADSEERTKLSDLMKRKKNGFKKSIKSEVKEWHHAMDGIRKLAKGEKLDEHHKGALKAVSIHSGIVIGDMALAGGMTTMAAAVGTFASGFLAHTLGIHVGKTAVYATNRPDFDKMTDDELLDWYVDNMANAVKSANIPAKDWLKAVTKGSKKREKSKR